VSTIKGYPSQLKKDSTSSEFVTVNPIGQGRYGVDQSGGTVTNAASDVSEVGSTKCEIVATGHIAVIGDVVRWTSGPNSGTEAIVIDVETNLITLGTCYSVNIAAGDAFDILKPVSLTLASDGTITVTSGPVQFVRNGSNVQVTEDTVTPANNLPLPVKLTSVTGDINITAGDLNVQLSDQGANPDATRIGDGTNRWAFNGSSEGLVKDTTTNTELSTLNGKVTNCDTDNVTVVSSVLPTGAATETTLSSINTKTPSLGQALMAASQPVAIASDQSTLPISAIALPLPTGAATEASLNSLNSKVTVCDTGNVTVSSSALPTGAATEAKQDVGNSSLSNIDTSLDVALSTRASEATLSNVDTNTGIIANWDTNTGSVTPNTQRITICTEDINVLEPKYFSVNTTTFTDMSSTNIPGNASLPLELIASTATDILAIHAFDTGGAFYEIMIGAASSEVRRGIIGPGSDQQQAIYLNIGQRVSIRRVDSASPVTVGQLAINYLQG